MDRTFRPFHRSRYRRLRCFATGRWPNTVRMRSSVCSASCPAGDSPKEYRNEWFDPSRCQAGQKPSVRQRHPYLTSWARQAAAQQAEEQSPLRPRTPALSIAREPLAQPRVRSWLPISSGLRCRSYGPPTLYSRRPVANPSRVPLSIPTVTGGCSCSQSLLLRAAAQPQRLLVVTHFLEKLRQVAPDP